MLRVRVRRFETGVSRDTSQFYFDLTSKEQQQDAKNNAEL